MLRKLFGLPQFSIKIIPAEKRRDHLSYLMDRWWRRLNEYDIEKGQTIVDDFIQANFLAHVPNNTNQLYSSAEFTIGATVAGHAAVSAAFSKDFIDFAKGNSSKSSEAEFLQEICSPKLYSAVLEDVEQNAEIDGAASSFHVSQCRIEGFRTVVKYNSIDQVEPHCETLSILTRAGLTIDEKDASLTCVFQLQSNTSHWELTSFHIN